MFPSSLSTGQTLFFLNINQPDISNIKPEKIKMIILCSLNVIKKGKVLVIAATVAPKPKVTKIIGKAQQTSVPVVVNKAKTESFF